MFALCGVVQIDTCKLTSQPFHDEKEEESRIKGWGLGVLVSMV